MVKLWPMQNEPTEKQTSWCPTITKGDVVGWLIFIVAFEIIKLSLVAANHWLKFAP